MKLALAGAGAFGRKHLDAIALIDGAEVVSVIDRPGGSQEAVANDYGIAHWSDDLADALALDTVDAVISGNTHADARQPGNRRHGSRQTRTRRDSARRQPG